MNATIICLHARRSGRLSFNAAGLLDAHLICDACGAIVEYLPEQSAQARAQYMPRARAIAAA